MIKNAGAKFVTFSFTTFCLFFPASVYAMNPSYLHKSQSIGSIFRELLFGYNFSILILYFGLLILILPTLAMSYFVHRKHTTYLFVAIYLLFSINYIVFGEWTRLSDALAENIMMYYLGFILAIVAFFSSTFFNKFRKKKHKLERKDHSPLAIVIVITLILFILPIRSGHLICKTPVLSEHFNCVGYLVEDKKLERSWFVF